MDVIARSAFGLELNSLTDQHNPFVSYANKFFRTLSIINPIALALLLFPFCVNILKWLRVKIMPTDAINFFIHIIDDTIASRKASQQKTVDFLQILIDAEEKHKSAQENSFTSNHKLSLNGHINHFAERESVSLSNSPKLARLSKRSASLESIGESCSNPYKSVLPLHLSEQTISNQSDSVESLNQSIPDLPSNQSQPVSPKPVGLSLAEIHAQSLIFFIAGYETTASSLSYVAYCLATNPCCQDTLRAEIDAHFPPPPPRPDPLPNRPACKESAAATECGYEQYNQLAYLDMCIHEALRLYPPAVRTTRVCSEDTQIGDIVIQRGMLVAIPIYHLHMDPGVWPEPQKFIPERFSSSSSSSSGGGGSGGSSLGRRSYSYLPFGAGPRRCVGSRLALLELKVATVHLLRHYRLLPAPDTQNPLSFKKKGLLQPEHDIKLLLEPRTFS